MALSAQEKQFMQDYMLKEAFLGAAARGGVSKAVGFLKSLVGAGPTRAAVETAKANRRAVNDLRQFTGAVRGKTANPAAAQRGEALFTAGGKPFDDALDTLANNSAKRLMRNTLPAGTPPAGTPPAEGFWAFLKDQARRSPITNNTGINSLLRGIRGTGQYIRRTGQYIRDNPGKTGWGTAAVGIPVSNYMTAKGVENAAIDTAAQQFHEFSNRPFYERLYAGLNPSVLEASLPVEIQQRLEQMRRAGLQ